MFWQIVGAVTFIFFLLEIQRINSKPPYPGTTELQAIIGRTIGDFLWILAIAWIVSLLIKVF